MGGIGVGDMGVGREAPIQIQTSEVTEMTHVQLLQPGRIKKNKI